MSHLRYIFLFLFLITACHTAPSSHLNSVYLVSRNGTTETVTNAKKLKEFENISAQQMNGYEKVIITQSKKHPGKIYSELFTYHENGHLSRFLQLCNGRASGLYKEWFPNGNLKLEAHVIEGIGDCTQEAQKSWLFDGISSSWNDDGSLTASFIYEKGSLEGYALYFYPNGKLKRREFYKKNLKDGIETHFKNNNEIFLTASYSNGLLDGNSQGFWNQNQIQFKEFFEKGFLVEGVYFNKANDQTSFVSQRYGVQTHFISENILEEREIQDGSQKGFVRTFKNGLLVSEYFLDNSMKNGIETIFYEEQQLTPKLSISWVDGRIEGYVKTWYKTGQQETIKSFSQNKKHGLSTCWYSNGDLMFVEEYDMNLLKKGLYYKLGKTIVSEVKNGNGTVSLFSSKGILKKKIHYKDGTPEID